MYYWVEFIGHSSGTVEAKDVEGASLLAKEITGKEVRGCSRIPYPASPKLHKMDCPTFCFQPTKCKGSAACPSRHSCTDQY